MSGDLEKSSRFGFILLLLIIAVVVALSVLWLLRPQPAATDRTLRLTPVAFSDLPEWHEADIRSALVAFRRSCASLLSLPSTRAMGGAGYAGTVGDWQNACRTIPDRDMTSTAARIFFESRFTPFAIGAGDDRDGLFTGYYEPELRASRSKSAKYTTPIYGLPDDLISADLGLFRSELRDEHIEGRLDGHRLIPYPTRTEIDAAGLPNARVLLYADDPIGVFFLQIQGSGRARLTDGSYVRLAFAGVNGRAYTPIGRVLIAQGAMDRQSVSLQSIRAWLVAHPSDASRIMESDDSYVFFREAPLGDPSLGSTGSEGVPLEPNASLAVDPRLHALGAPFFVAATYPDPNATKTDEPLDRLFVAQDTGGAIRGAVRADVFWGFGPWAEAIAGRMKSHGQLYVLLPKSVASGLGQSRDFPGASQ